MIIDDSLRQLFKEIKSNTIENMYVPKSIKNSFDVKLDKENGCYLISSKKNKKIKNNDMEDVLIEFMGFLTLEGIINIDQDEMNRLASIYSAKSLKKFCHKYTDGNCGWKNAINNGSCEGCEFFKF